MNLEKDEPTYKKYCKTNCVIELKNIDLRWSQKRGNPLGRNPYKKSLREYCVTSFMNEPSTLEVCIPECHFPGTRLFPGFFTDFPKQPDHREVVWSRSHQFGNCPPVSSCLVSFKTSSGTQTSTQH